MSQVPAGEQPFPAVLTADPGSLHLFPMLCSCPLGLSQQSLPNARPTSAPPRPPGTGTSFLTGPDDFSVKLESVACDPHDASIEHHQHGLEWKSSDASGTHCSEVWRSCVRQGWE